MIEYTDCLRSRLNASGRCQTDFKSTASLIAREVDTPTMIINILLEYLLLSDRVSNSSKVGALFGVGASHKLYVYLL